MLFLHIQSPWILIFMSSIVFLVLAVLSGDRLPWITNFSQKYSPAGCNAPSSFCTWPLQWNSGSLSLSLSHCSYFLYSAGESSFIHPWTTLLQTLKPMSVGLGRSTEKQSFYHLPTETSLNISMVKDLISISFPCSLFYRTNDFSEAVILCLGKKKMWITFSTLKNPIA